MSSGSQKNKPFLLIALTIIIVILFAHFFNWVTILGYTIKPIDLFMDIKPDSLQSLNQSSINNSNAFVSDNYRKNKTANSNSKTLSAGISFKPVNKIITETKNLFIANNRAENYGQQKLNIKDEPITGNLDQMKYFFDALKNSKTEKIRVAMETRVLKGITLLRIYVKIYKMNSEAAESDFYQLLHKIFHSD